MKRAWIPVLVAATALSALAQDSVTLRYNLKPGKVYRYATQMKMDMEGGPMPVDMKMNTVACLKVKDVVDGFISTVSYYDYVRVSSNQPGMDQMLGAQDSDMKKFRVYQQFDLLGNPKGEPKVTGGPPSGQLGSFSGFTGSSALGIALPKEPLTVGKSWEQILDSGRALGSLPETGSQNPFKVVYTVRSFQDYRGRKAVTIGMVVKGNMALGALAGQDPNAPKMELGLDGTGTLVIDQATGLTLKSGMSLKVNASLEAVPQGSPQSFKQNIRVDSELLDLAGL